MFVGQLTCIEFAAAGYAVCALDFEGHGRSDGLRVAFRRSDHIVADCMQYFVSVHRGLTSRACPATSAESPWEGPLPFLLSPGTPTQQYSKHLMFPGTPTQQHSLHPLSLPVCLSPCTSLCPPTHPLSAPSHVWHGCAQERGAAGGRGGRGGRPGPAVGGLILLSPMLRIKDEGVAPLAPYHTPAGARHFIPDAPIVPAPDTIRYSHSTVL